MVGFLFFPFLFSFLKKKSRVPGALKKSYFRKIKITNWVMYRWYISIYSQSSEKFSHGATVAKSHISHHSQPPPHQPTTVPLSVSIFRPIQKNLTGTFRLFFCVQNVEYAKAYIVFVARGFWIKGEEEVEDRGSDWDFLRIWELIIFSVAIFIFFQNAKMFKFSSSKKFLASSWRLNGWF